MSAENGEAKPSIDDILSSIRQMIADENTASDGSKLQNEGAPMSTTSRNGSEAHQSAAEPVEDVLDLSEEFIVTEAAAAAERERQRQAQEQADVAAFDEATDDDAEPSQQPDASATPAEPEDELAAEQPHHQEAAEVAPENVWSEDFQMPVGAEGPASPFTAARASPESAWPNNEPFDVTELYSRARSSSPQARAVQVSEDSEPDDDPADVARDDDLATSYSGDSAHVHEMDDVGLELASLSVPQDAPDAGLPGENGAQEDDGEPEESDAPLTETVPRIHAAEEIEAAFGMPQRGLAHANEPAPVSETEWLAAGEAEPRLSEQSENEPVDAVDRDKTHDADREDNGEAEAWPVEAGFTEPAHGEVHETEQPDELEPAYAAAPGRSMTAGPDALGPTAVPGSGKSLEDSVKELLRPMLQEWLDKNMPRLVEAAMREQMAAASREGSADDTDGGDAPPHERKFGTDR